MFRILIIALCLTWSVSSFSQENMLLLKKSGKVVIGDTSKIATPGNYSLYVQNGILTERVKVALRDQGEWKDTAFEFTPTIDQVSQSIISKSHLYGMPSASHLVENGYELKQMDALLLEQVEWLWQHVIDLNQEKDKVSKQLYSQAELLERMDALTKEMQALKSQNLQLQRKLESITTNK